MKISISIFYLFSISSVTKFAFSILIIWFAPIRCFPFILKKICKLLLLEETPVSFSNLNTSPFSLMTDPFSVMKLQRSWISKSRSTFVIPGYICTQSPRWTKMRRDVGLFSIIVYMTVTGRITEAVVTSRSMIFFSLSLVRT